MPREPVLGPEAAIPAVLVAQLRRVMRVVGRRHRVPSIAPRTRGRNRRRRRPHRPTDAPTPTDTDPTTIDRLVFLFKLGDRAQFVLVLELAGQLLGDEKAARVHDADVAGHVEPHERLVLLELLGQHGAIGRVQPVVGQVEVHKHLVVGQRVGQRMDNRPRLEEDAP